MMLRRLHWTVPIQHMLKQPAWPELIQSARRIVAGKYDVTADYRFSEMSDEKWLSPLCLEARTGRIEADSGGSTSVTKEHRLILNYEWWSGGLKE